MIILKKKNEKEIRFNLKNWEREQQLINVLNQLKKEGSSSTIKLVTTYNENISFKIDEVENFEFIGSEYIKAAVHESIKTNQQKPKSFVDSVMNTLQEKQKEKVEKFLNALQLQNIPIDLNDPILLKTIDTVKDSQESKIPFFVNLYKNFSRGKPLY